MPETSSLQAPQLQAPAQASPPSPAALTRRSLLIGISLLLLWIVTISFSVPNGYLMQQQLLMLMGFGAVLSLFLVKFLCDFLPLRLRLTPAELTFVYALLLAGIPATIMGRLALESAAANHFLEDSPAGRRGFVPDFWAPNPHLGPLPRLDVADARCPYLELPPAEDGRPRRAALPAPTLSESLEKTTAATVRARAFLEQTRQAGAQYHVSRSLADTLKEAEEASGLAAAALAEIAASSQIDPLRAAYLAWAAELAAESAARGPQCVHNADALNGFIKGKVPVPWAAWLLPLLYWFLLILAFVLLIAFGLLALRNAWIEQERLPFPNARVAEGVVYPEPGARQDMQRQESFPRLALGLAFLLGMLFCVRGLVTISDTGGFAVPPSNMLFELDLSWLNIVRGVPLKLALVPFALLFLLFFPLDLLFTVVVVYIGAQYVIPWLFELLSIPNTVDIRYNMLRMGGMLGISVFTVVFNWADFKRLLTGLWTHTADTEGQPLSPRQLSLAFLMSLSLFCVLLFIGEGQTGQSFLGQWSVLLYTLAIIFIYNLCFVRARASGSFHYFDFNNILHAGGYMNWHWLRLTHTIPMAQGSKIVEPDSVLSYHSLYQMEAYGAYSHAIGPAPQLLDAFSLAESTKARLRDVLKGILLGSFLALLIGMPLYLIAVYNVGYDNTPMAGAWNSYTLVTDKAYRYYTKIYPGMLRDTILWWILAGALLVGLCMYLRREYSRFPIEPIGIFIAGSNGVTIMLGTEIIWFTFVVALAAKWIFFRWYGVRAFQEKVVPLLVYCLMGMVLGAALYLVLSALILGRGIAV